MPLCMPLFITATPAQGIRKIEEKDDAMFKQDYRMSRKAFNKLIEMLQQYVSLWREVPL